VQSFFKKTANETLKSTGILANKWLKMPVNSWVRFPHMRNTLSLIAQHEFYFHKVVSKAWHVSRELAASL
jgi:hypothetical protein